MKNYTRLLRAITDECKNQADGVTLIETRRRLVHNLAQLQLNGIENSTESARTYAQGLNSLGELTRELRLGPQTSYYLHEASAKTLIAQRGNINLAISAYLGAAHAVQDCDPSMAQKAVKIAEELALKESLESRIEVKVRKAELLSSVGDVRAAIRIYQREVWPIAENLPVFNDRNDAVRRLAYAGLLMLSGRRGELDTAQGLVEGVQSNSSSKDYLVRYLFLCQKGSLAVKVGSSTSAEDCFFEMEKLRIANTLPIHIAERLRKAIDLAA